MYHTPKLFLYGTKYSRTDHVKIVRKNLKKKNFTRDQRQDVFIDKKPKQTQKHKDICSLEKIPGESLGHSFHEVRIVFFMANTVSDIKRLTNKDMVR